MHPIKNLSGFPLQELSLKEIEASLKYFLRWYLRRRSTHLATAIAQHFEALVAHSNFDRLPEQRCIYRYLARQWRYLALRDVNPDIS